MCFLYSAVRANYRTCNVSNSIEGELELMFTPIHYVAQAKSINCHVEASFFFFLTSHSTDIDTDITYSVSHSLTDRVQSIQHNRTLFLGESELE